MQKGSVILVKKLICLCLTLLLICSFAGCSPKEKLIEAPNGVKLPNYKNLEFVKAEYDVSDKFIDNMLNELVKNYATTEKITEGSVSEGDTINITYISYVGEQILTDAAMSDFTLTLGKGTLIEDFEKSFINKNVGKEFDVEVSYPLGSTFTILDGKTVTHRVTVNYIIKTTYPELTDELIQTYVKNSVVTKEAACKTVSDYREYLRERYEFVYSDIANDNLIADILDYLLEKSEFPEIPEKDINDYVNDKYEYYVQYCKDNGFSIDVYLAMEEITEDEFKAQLKKDGEILIKKTMIVNAIKELEGLTLTDEAYKDYLEYLVVYYQFDTVEDLQKSITELDVEKTIKSDATYEVVYQFLINNQNIKTEKKDLYDSNNLGVTG